MHGRCLAFLVLLVSGPASAGAPIAFFAEQATADAAPQGCTPALTGGGGAVKWVAVAEPEAPRGLALAETSRDPTDTRFPLCVVATPAARNVDVTVRFRPVAGRVDQAGGIAVRYADARTYYVVRANALEDNVRLYHVTNGVRREFAGKDTKVARGQWHSLRLRLIDDRFEVWFDGAALFAATDLRIAGAGQVALWTKADSLTHFAELSVETLP